MKTKQPITKKAKPTIIKFADVPHIFMDETGYKLADYSVALGYFEDEKATIPKMIGSGVFVSWNNRFGILTAHHCVHRPGPNLNLGCFGGHRLGLVVTAIKASPVIIPPEVVQKHALATPNLKTHEPDLAFLEIFPSPLLSSLRAKACFWHLNERNFKKAKKFGKINKPFAVIGFPGVYQKIVEGIPRRHLLKHMAYYYSIQKNGISKRKGWDYVVANARYYEGHDLPPTFQGVSGGPVWALDVRGKKGDSNLKLEDFCLVGIAFFEIPISKKRMQIKAHFIDSIYRTGWKTLG